MKKALLIILFSFLFFLFLLVGCQQWLTSSRQEESTAAVDIPPTAMTTVTATSTPEPLITPEHFVDELLLEELPTLAPEPTMHSSMPLAMVFPTPLPPDDILWRPPLYEVPWAPGPYDHFYFVRPIAVNAVNSPLPDYRYGGTFFGPDIVHTGIDYSNPKGTPVLAAGPGRVVWAGTGLYFGVYNPEDPYGLAVVIEHEFGYHNETLYTVYAHLDTVSVNIGDEVGTHDLLGTVGDTGFTTGPHLHFEIRTGRNTFYRTRNPELWMAPPQGWGILAGRIMNAASGPIQKLFIRVVSLETRRERYVITYTMLGVNSDDYYNENFVLSDLPAGRYEVSFTYEDTNYAHTIDIRPGVVTFFSFHPRTGFSNDPPPAPQNAPHNWLIIKAP